MLAPIVFALALRQTTDLVFIRHGETIANATGVYNAKNLEWFSDKGRKGVLDLTSRLQKAPKFDVILVSPSPRALATIAPYLRATHQHGIIWPLLYECCTQKRPSGAEASSFKFGEKIVLPQAVEGLFIMVRGQDKYPVANDYNSGLAQVDAAVKEFRRKYAGRRILLVGHSGQGGHMLHELTGRWQKVDNTKEIEVKI